MTKGIYDKYQRLMNWPVYFQEGVGDTRDSYAYDGRRQRKWNATTQKYGEVHLLLSKPFNPYNVGYLMQYIPSLFLSNKPQGFLLFN